MSTTIIKQQEFNGMINPSEITEFFKLSPDFIKNFENKEPKWNDIGKITYKRTYARQIFDEDRTENYYETIQRVVEGMFSVGKSFCKKFNVKWDEAREQKDAEEMYKLIFGLKFSPSGRVLWTAGTKQMYKYGSMALCNCAFITTDTVDKNSSYPFEWVMDTLMLGVGVGFDCEGAGKLTIHEPKFTNKVHIIEDTRDSWVESHGIVLKGFFEGKDIPIFDYTHIRPEGEFLKTFGGKSAGYKPLKQLHESVIKLLTKDIGKPLSSLNILDIMNHTGKCVIAGNIRRSAEIALGKATDNEFINAKNDAEALASHRWSSNNSILGYKGMDYTKIIESIIKMAEPSVFWIENAQKYSRTGSKPDWKDKEVKGVNPCFSGEEELLCVPLHGESEAQYVSFAELNGKEVLVKTPIGKLVRGKVWSSGVKKTIKLTFSNSSKKHDMIVTPDHVFMTSDGREIQAIDTKGERLRIHFEPNVEFNKDWVKMGFIQGDGNLTRLNGKHIHKGLEVNIGVNDDDIRTLFGFDDNGCRKYYTNELFDEMNKYGFQSKILPEREMPDVFNPDNDNNLLYDNEVVSSFLRGLYSANGSVIKKGRIAFKTTCLQLANQIKFILLSNYDIEAYITTNKPKSVKFSNGEYECRESYDVNISQIWSIVKFYEEIGFVHKYKTVSLENVIIERSPKVIKINENSECEVFDFSAPDIHWGFVNGFVVHNCGEQALFSGETCNLVETFPSHHKTLKEFLNTLRLAHKIAKFTTLLETHKEETNEIIKKNRRIGVSQSGIIDAFARHGRKKMKNMLKKGYDYLKECDRKFSKKYNIQESIKITTVKPSGTVSLLAGVSAGIHYPHSEYYIRRIRIAKSSELTPILIEGNYPYEVDNTDDKTYVFSFPVHKENFKTSKFDVSADQQLDNAIMYQKYWSDNGVSITITFQVYEEKDLPALFKKAEDNFMKGMALLPLSNHKYKQAPYEKISENTYNDMLKAIKPVSISGINEEGKGSQYCSGGYCKI